MGDGGARGVSRGHGRDRDVRARGSTPRTAVSCGKYVRYGGIGWLRWVRRARAGLVVSRRAAAAARWVGKLGECVGGRAPCADAQGQPKFSGARARDEAAGAVPHRVRAKLPFSLASRPNVQW